MKKSAFLLLSLSFLFCLPQAGLAYDPNNPYDPNDEYPCDVEDFIQDNIQKYVFSLECWPFAWEYWSGECDKANAMLDDAKDKYYSCMSEAGFFGGAA